MCNGDVAMGKVIKEYNFQGNRYKLCEGTSGLKYDLWKYGRTIKQWWLIDSNNDKSKCRAK